MKLFHADQVWRNAQFALEHFGLGIGHGPAFFGALDDKMDRKSCIFAGFTLIARHVLNSASAVGSL